MQIANQPSSNYYRQNRDIGNKTRSFNQDFNSVQNSMSSQESSIQEFHLFGANDKDTTYTGSSSNGLSFALKYDENSTKENPIINAYGLDENGNSFEQSFNINDIDPKNATILELRALEAHFNGGKHPGMSSSTTMLSMGNHGENQQAGLNDRTNYIDRLMEKTDFYGSSPYLSHQQLGVDFRQQLDNLLDFMSK